MYGQYLAYGLAVKFAELRKVHPPRFLPNRHLLKQDPVMDGNHSETRPPAFKMMMVKFLVTGMS